MASEHRTVVGDVSEAQVRECTRWWVLTGTTGVLHVPLAALPGRGGATGPDGRPPATTVCDTGAASYHTKPTAVIPDGHKPVCDACVSRLLSKGVLDGENGGGGA